MSRINQLIYFFHENSIGFLPNTIRRYDYSPRNVSSHIITPPFSLMTKILIFVILI